MKNLALSTRQRREQIGSIEFGTEEKLRASKISEMYVAIRLRRVGAVSDELVGAFLVRLRCVTQCERRAPGTHIHLMARDPDEHKRLWVGVLDAEVTHSGSFELLKIPFAS